MSDYRLKQDYQDVKAGTISKEWRDHAWNPIYVFKYVFKNSKIEIEFNKEEINDLLQRDIVEKLPEPKWRDKDMIEFAERMVISSYATKSLLDSKHYYLKLIEYEQSRQS